MLLNIELAKVSDSEECEALTQLAAMAKDGSVADPNGFLLSTTSAARFREFIESDSLYIARSLGVVAGFVVAYPRGTRLFEELFSLFPRIQWIDPSIAERKQLIYVDKKAVHPSYRRMGVATAMYEFLFKKFPDYSFIGATVEKPILNIPSQQFRTRHGFLRVGEFRSAEFEGIRDYQSGIYFREAYNRPRN